MHLEYPSHYPPQNSHMNLNFKMLINFHLEIGVNMLLGGNCLLVYKDSLVVKYYIVVFWNIIPNILWYHSTTFLNNFITTTMLLPSISALSATTSNPQIVIIYVCWKIFSKSFASFLRPTNIILPSKWMHEWVDQFVVFAKTCCSEPFWSVSKSIFYLMDFSLKLSTR